MTEKPMMIPPGVKSPDYGEFLRRSLPQTPLGARSFARTVAEQESALRQNSVPLGAGDSRAARSLGGAAGGAANGMAGSAAAASAMGSGNGAGNGSVGKSVGGMPGFSSAFAGEATPSGENPVAAGGGLPPMPGAGSRIAAMAALQTSMMTQGGGLQGAAEAASGGTPGQVSDGNGARSSRSTSKASDGSLSGGASGDNSVADDQTAEKTVVRGRLNSRSISMPQREEEDGEVQPRSIGIALDDRALSTLQRVGQGFRSSIRRHVRKTTDGGEDGESAEGLGKLSARYESGSQGVSAIGYDRNGGTSYGKYQISSRQGTFGQFVEFLSGEAPELADRLRKAGKANTGGTRGAVPTEWKAIAAEQPERFEKLQESFIRDSHYNPALASVQNSLGLKELSEPMQEVLWSTAVQHGPTGAKRIFEQAAGQLAAKGKSPADEKALIETVYSLRKGQFSSSAPSVQAAVRQRFDDERRQALAMLHEQAAVA